MLAITNKTSDSNVYITKFIEYDKQAIEDAITLFSEYKDENVIQNNSFDDHVWIITNETNTIEVAFEFSETLFFSQKKAEYNRKLGSYVDFVNAVKIYIIHSLNHTSLLIIQRFISILKSVIKQTKYFNPNFSDELVKKVKFNTPNYVTMLIELTNFFPLLDIEQFQEQCKVTYDELSEELNTKQRGKKQQRQLAEFQSFFLFDKLLNQFWNYMATDDEKTTYFPVYLWWKITNILPLRPTELIVTPFNCIRENEFGEFFLTIRRTNLKGHKKGKSKGIVTHKVDSDYTLFEYPVSKEIADLLTDYQKRVRKYGEQKFLFSKKAYQESLGVHKGMSETRSLSSEFTLKNLRVIMARYYKKVIQERFGIRLFYKKHHALGDDKAVFEDEDTFLKPSEIMVINIGDTRHFSMVNIVLSDFNPILIKDFAGHEDINQSYHYFDHIDKIVKCMTHYKFHELRKAISDNGAIVFNESINLESIAREIENKNEAFKEVDYGKCFSRKFIVGDISDCIPAFGDCANCDFSKIDNQKYDGLIKSRRLELERRLREEGLLLQKVLERFNESHDEFADFQRVILRVQQATSEYINISKKLISGDYHDNPKR